MQPKRWTVLNCVENYGFCNFSNLNPDVEFLGKKELTNFSR